MQSDAQRQELRGHFKAAVSSNDAPNAVRFAKEFLSSSNNPAGVMLCASSFARMAEALTVQLGARRLRTYIVRSVTVEPFVPYLAVEAVFANYVLDIKVGGYGSYVEELLSAQSALATHQPDLVLVLLDLEDIAGRLPDICAQGKAADVETELGECVSRIGQLLKGFRSHNSARLLLQGCVLPNTGALGDVGEANLPSSLTNAVRRLNQRLASLCNELSDCVFFDVDHVAARHGRATWRDERMFLSSRLPVASASFSAYTRGLVRTLSVLFRAPRKVLCTDLDNTLWGGILGEDGAEGISTGVTYPGNCYLQYQKYLKQLSARGILLVIVSKNNEADVREAFKTRAADLAITLDDFVSLKINWNEKSESIREIAAELSLGLDSFVFVDDNPVECEAIRQRLPELAVVPAPVEEPWELVEMLSGQSFFDVANVTDDDVNRVQEYKAQAQRAELASSTGSRDDFLASLEIVCTFQSALQAPLARAVQLLAKTNQFNLTTRRHSAAEVEEFASAPGGQAIVVRVRDRFGDAGVVGLALAHTQGDACSIDSLLLSCRVIGRGIETAILAHLAENALKAGATRLVGEFVPTKKNAPSESFYPEHGFTRTNDVEAGSPDSIFYELDLTVAPPVSPTWITLEGIEINELSASPVFSS